MRHIDKLDNYRLVMCMNSHCKAEYIAFADSCEWCDDCNEDWITVLKITECEDANTILEATSALLVVTGNSDLLELPYIIYEEFWRHENDWQAALKVANLLIKKYVQ